MTLNAAQHDGLEDLIEPTQFVGDDDNFSGDDHEDERPENRYWFRVDDKTLSIPLLNYLPVESALCFEQGRNIEGLLLGADDEVRKFILGLKGSAFKRFMQRWEAKSKVSPGESAASSAPSVSTGGRSSMTSGETA